MMRVYLGLCRPQGQLAVYVIPYRLVLSLFLIYLVIVRDTVVVAALVGAVPIIVVMVMGRGVLEDLVGQDVQLSRLLVIFSAKVRGGTLVLAIVEVEGRVLHMRITIMLASPFLVVMVVIRSI